VRGVNLIIDRRLNGKNKSAVNRARFLRRYKAQIKKAVSDAVGGRSITDMERGEKINIPARDLSEPAFHHGRGGSREVVQPGNKEFVAGDRVPRPNGGGEGRGSKASKDGEGEDDFGFQLSREEFLQFFFEDLALPDLVKTQLATTPEQRTVRAGYTTSGTPTNINVVRSLRGALARRIALQSPYRSQLRAAEEQLAENPGDASKVLALEEEIKRLKRRMEAVPFIDSFDLRYNHRVRQPKPSTQAVMFCLMDVSGSMDEARKDMAKRFFALLYMFLTRSYERTQVVFIRHHTQAKEVDEDEFFSSRESGGTVVSSALELMERIIAARYPTSEWNIYGAQASDGDNWHEDSPKCRELLLDKLLPALQYYAYVQIGADEEQGLWTEYEEVAASTRRFAMQKIRTPAGIYPVFRELFKKKDAA
jgi:uncharacterized sporulation protein YeaH/YhbH (DUF444 family)